MRKMCSRAARLGASVLTVGLLAAVPPLLSVATSDSPPAGAATVSAIGDVTIYRGSVSNPTGIAVGRDGAMWFTNQYDDSIGRISTTGVVSSYTGVGISQPTGIAAGSDGALWFTNQADSSIGRISTSGTVTTYTGAGISNPVGITSGPDGALWFTNQPYWFSGNGNSSIGRITTTGTVTSYTGVGISFPNGIGAGPDGALWFTNSGNSSIGRITTTGAVSAYSGVGISRPTGITAGPDGALWFANQGSDSIGRITTNGAVTRFTGVGISEPSGITAGPDGALWFTDQGSDSIGRITTAGTVTSHTGTGISDPKGIAVGPDGALWFANQGRDSIGRVTALVAPPVIVPGAATVAEGAGGSRTLSVPVSLSASSRLPVTAHWTTVDHTATAPSDYVAASGTVTFAPGETTETVPVVVNGDAAIEPDEALLVAFSAATNATIGGFHGLGVGTIADDDVGAVTTRWTDAERGRVLQSAAYLNTTPDDLQKTGVMVLAYVSALTQPRPAASPLIPRPSSTGPLAYTTTWNASDARVLRDVEAQHSLTAEQAQKLGVQVVSFLLALDGH